MAMVAERENRCAVCGAVTRGDLLCPEHQEASREFTLHLKKLAKPEMIATSALTVDHRYQRAINETRIRSILMNFNEMKLGRLIVSRRARENVLLDGQQRWVALVRMGFAEAPCDVLEGLTLEQEILTFVGLNEDRTGVRKGVLFNDKAMAGVPVYADAMTILKSFRYEVVDPGARKSVSPNQLSCPGTIETVHRMGKLSVVLYTIRQTWPGESEPNRAEMLMGIAAFLQVNPQIKADELVEQIKTYRPDEILNAARATSKASIERRKWVHVYEAIRQRFNYHRQQKNRVSKIEIPSSAPRIWMG